MVYIEWILEEPVHSINFSVYEKLRKVILTRHTLDAIFLKVAYLLPPQYTICPINTAASKIRIISFIRYLIQTIFRYSR